MALQDFRIDPGNTDRMSFYIYDNLRSQQDRMEATIYRVDTPQKAVSLFKTLQEQHPDWTIALGGSLYGTSEIDFIHRMNGDNVMLTDRQGFPHFSTPEVDATVQQMAEQLGVAWRFSNDLVGERVLVPYLPGDDPMDRYLERMELRPEIPGDALTSINEAFVEGHGWCDCAELHSLAKDFGYYNPECPRVSRLNVAFTERGPGEGARVGYVDVAPSDFRQMKDVYELSHGQRIETKTLEGWHQFAEETGNHSMEAYFKQGDVVGKDVIDHFTNIMPPVTHYSDLLQVGERYDDRMGDDGRYHARFTTFSKEGAQWLYRGHCFRGERTEPLNPEKSVRDLAKEARVSVAEKNLARPEKTRSSESQDLSW